MKIVFMGTPRAAVSTLKSILDGSHEVAAVWTQPDRPSGRGNKVTLPPVKEFALDRSLPVFQPERIKTPESLKLFRSHQADAAVVVAYGRILPASFLEAFPRGAINVHFSLLPKYRGAAPVNWAIAAGDRVTGVTTMQMDAGLDTGDILLQRETGIGEEENSIELTERLSHLGAELLCETLRKLDGIIPKKQDHGNAVPAPPLRKEDGLIDWNMNAEAIRNRIRGFQPFPRSFTSCRRQKLTIWRAHSAANEIPGGNAVGEIIKAAGDDLLIKCGEDSVLRIGELQIEGKRRMTTRELLNGFSLRPGEVLGA